MFANTPVREHPCSRTPLFANTPVRRALANTKRGLSVEDAEIKNRALRARREFSLRTQ